MNTKFKEINWNPGLEERRGFGRILLIGFPFVALFWTVVLGFKGEGFVWNWTIFSWIAGTGCGVGLFCMALPALALPFYRVWFFLVCIIDTLITFILLPTFYYLILFPYGWFIRVLGKNPLEKKPAQCTTYWKEVAPTKDNSQYYRQF